MAGLGVALQRPEGPLLLGKEQVVDVVGEERPDRPVYMAGDPRTPFTPLPGAARCRWGQGGIDRVYLRISVWVCCLCARR